MSHFPSIGDENSISIPVEKFYVEQLEEELEVANVRLDILERAMIALLVDGREIVIDIADLSIAGAPDKVTFCIGVEDGMPFLDMKP